MWSRSYLKEKAKAAFSKNYWICVVVALILGFCGGGSSSSSSVDIPDFDEYEDDYYEDDYYTDDALYANSFYDDDEFYFGDDYDYEDIHDEAEDSIWVALGIGLLVFLVVFGIIMVIAVAFSTFVTNVLMVGCHRFYIINTEEKAAIGEIGYSFGKGRYWKTVSTIFLQNLYIFLWSLLFIIPGIIKAYEYYMVPYILADNPELSRKEVFELSKKMMYGNKWDTFVLELSFMGWDILSVFTCGILSVFYVNPYRYATFAELYMFLKREMFPPVMEQKDYSTQNPYIVNNVEQGYYE